MHVELAISSHSNTVARSATSSHLGDSVVYKPTKRETRLPTLRNALAGWGERPLVTHNFWIRVGVSYPYLHKILRVVHQLLYRSEESILA